MTHTPTHHGQAPEKPMAELDALFDELASPQADDLLDRRIFAFRQSLADFRSP